MESTRTGADGEEQEVCTFRVDHLNTAALALPNAAGEPRGQPLSWPMVSRGGTLRSV